VAFSFEKPKSVPQSDEFALESQCERKENKIQVTPRNTPTATPLNVNEQDNESSEKAGQPSPVGRPTVG
jgi:hypothetical protein